jgi:hypothetical protein
MFHGYATSQRVFKYGHFYCTVMVVGKGCKYQRKTELFPFLFFTELEIKII